MGDALTTTEFVDIAVSLGTEGFDAHFDVPELWAAIGRYPPQDCAVLALHLATTPPPVRADGTIHARTRDVLRMVARLAEYHAGAIEGAALRAAAEAMLVRASQEPIVAGFTFHVRGLLDPRNPVYALDRFLCQTPFVHLGVLERATHQCCASWLPLSAGDLSTQSYDEVWNSAAAVAVRRSILDGTFRYCNKSSCPHINGGRLIPRAQVEGDPAWAERFAGGGIARELPRHLNLAYDRHCNLSCPSCRTELISSDGADRERLDELTRRNVYPLLATAREVTMTGSGDPFASRTFRKLLSWVSDETCPDLKLVLMTNGLLLTPEEWTKFPNLRGKVRLIKVSMDGATKATHELLRQRSRWEVMMANLPFIGGLLAQGEIETFELVFVVQRDNYREMGAFVDLARAVGANRIHFDRITNWGTFSDAEYADRAVFMREHPRHADFLAAMADPRLLDPMIVMSNLKEFLPG